MSSGNTDEQAPSGGLLGGVSGLVGGVVGTAGKAVGGVVNTVGETVQTVGKGTGDTLHGATSGLGDTTSELIKYLVAGWVAIQVAARAHREETMQGQRS